MKMCLGVNCPDKFSKCCDAICISDRGKDLFVCGKCRKAFEPQACTAGEKLGKLRYCDLCKRMTKFRKGECIEGVGLFEEPNNHECIVGKCHPDIYRQKKELVDLVFTKEALHDAARYSNFSQAFKMLMWERGFKGEEKMEEVATILFNKYVKKV